MTKRNEKRQRWNGETGKLEKIKEREKQQGEMKKDKKIGRD